MDGNSSICETGQCSNPLPLWSRHIEGRIIWSYYTQQVTKMETGDKQSQTNEITLLLRKINDAWLTGNPELLRDFFHDEIVVKGPECQDASRGKEACVQ